MSPKVVNNILNINNGENFNYVSFQALTNSNKTNDGDCEIESKLINEYIEQTETDSGLLNFEMQDMLSELKKHLDKLSYNVFIDKYLNCIINAELIKKYNIKQSQLNKILKTSENICKELICE